MVKILQPDYLFGRRGILLGKEDKHRVACDRWLVRVMPDGFLVSLSSDEFRPHQNECKIV